MNDDTNNSLNVNNSDGIKDDFKIDTTKFADVTKPKEEVVDTTNNVESSNDSLESTLEKEEVVQDVSNDLEQVDVASEKATVTSETVIDADINNEVATQEEVVVGTIEEVSVSVDSDSFNNLSENEISEDSVFNKKDTPSEGSMKEGAENEKKGFPFFMVFIFVSVVIAAFFIDDIVLAVQNYQNSKKKPEEEEVVKEDTLKVVTLKDIYNGLEDSKYVIDFESKNNIELTIFMEGDNLLFTAPNYLDITNENSTLDAQFVAKDNVLSINTTIDNSAFALEMSILLIKEIAVLQGVNMTNLDSYISNNLYTNSLDKGFEFTNSEDGNNYYQIAMNVKLDIPNNK